MRDVSFFILPVKIIVHLIVFWTYSKKLPKICPIDGKRTTVKKCNFII